MNVKVLEVLETPIIADCSYICAVSYQINHLSCCVFCCSVDQATVRGKEWSYIASQGPLSSTCQDFWQMVWEQGVAIIAMVTAEEVKIKTSEIWLLYTVALFASSNRLVLCPVLQEGGREKSFPLLASPGLSPQHCYIRAI